MNGQNPILLSDSYKLDHWKQYPAGTTEVYSYFESRGGEYERTIFFGLQMLLKKFLVGCVVEHQHINEAASIVAGHMGNSELFNRAGWQHIVKHHGGRLPVSVSAVPEGTSVPVSTPLMTIYNTDPKCFWLTNYLETVLVQTWYPTTVATISREIRKTITEFLEKTGDPSLISFKLHDFGFRGASSVETAGIGGCAHLVNFLGTDTMAALIAARDYYGEAIAGHSIPASEHSTITSWGQENEVKAFENMLDQHPEGLVACVSDSYDILRACSQYWGKDLKDKVLARQGQLVVRPDSGDPKTIVLSVLKALGDAFGTTTNEKGFKVLDPHVRVIQGDGVNPQSIKEILSEMVAEKWSADNIAFGMGGALLQKLDRDTQKFAFKCSSITVNGEVRDVMKKPVTADWKSSKAGKFDVGPEVFRDGKLLVDHKFSEVRSRALQS